MSFLSELFSNHMLVCALVAYFTAQILKIILNFINRHKLELSLILSSGGMPSSHSSTVCALCISSARVCGVNSAAFAISGVLSAIVMYDAAGVRRAAGEQAKVLNRLLEDLMSGDPELADASLKELIGHTSFQVFMGALLGILNAFLIPMP